MTLSWQTMAALVPIGLLAGLSSASNVDLATRLAWLGAASLAQVALTAVYAAGAALGLGRWRAAVLLVVVLGGAARAASVVVLTAALGGIDPLGPAQRMIVATVTFTLWGVAIGAGLQSWSNHHTRLHALAASTDQALAEADELSRQWRRRLDESGPSPRALAATAHALQDDIDQRLRPLSHRLWFGITDRTARRRLLTLTMTMPLQLAWISGLSFFLFTWNVSPIYGVGPTAGAAIVGLTVFNVVLILAQWLRVRRPEASVSITLTAIVISTVAYALVVAALLGISDPVIVSVSVVAQVGEILGVQLIAAVSASRDAAVDELTRRTEDLEHERAEVAAYLHSTVQARWTAAARRLETASERGDVDAARLALDDAKSLLEGIEGYSSNVPALAELAAAWDGIATVVIDSPHVLPATSQALVGRIVDEAIANAVRHGEARRVDISIAVDGERVVITAEDDGSGASTSAQAGLGSEWLTTVATWSLARTASGSRLVAEIGV